MQLNKILYFLEQLKHNNNREWFAANRGLYDEAKEIFEGMSKKLILEIAKFDDDIKHVEAKDCIFRIYRDTRFSNDKTPYKTHFGVFVASAGGRKSQRGGYYLHIDPDGCFVGAGVWCPGPNLLKSLRRSIYDNIDELNQIRREPKFATLFPTFYQNEALKTVPREFPKDFPDGDLLKLKHYLVEYKLGESDLNKSDFIEHVAGIFEFAYPFNKFLNYTVDEVLS